MAVSRQQRKGERAHTDLVVSLNEVDRDQSSGKLKRLEFSGMNIREGSFTGSRSAPKSYTGHSLSIWLSTDICMCEKKLLRMGRKMQKLQSRKLLDNAHRSNKTWKSAFPQARVEKSCITWTIG